MVRRNPRRLRDTRQWGITRIGIDDPERRGDPSGKSPPPFHLPFVNTIYDRFVSMLVERYSNQAQVAFNRDRRFCSKLILVVATRLDACDFKAKTHQTRPVN